MVLKETHNEILVPKTCAQFSDAKPCCSLSSSAIIRPFEERTKFSAIYTGFSFTQFKLGEMKLYDSVTRVMETTSIAEALVLATQQLRKAGVPDARLEAGSLLAHVLGRDRTFIISHADETINESELERFSEIVATRATGRPLQYITGRQEFYGLDFDLILQIFQNVDRAGLERTSVGGRDLISRDQDDLDLVSRS